MTLREALRQEPSSHVDAGDAELLMSTWAALVTGGSRAKLQARLSWDGLTLKSAARRLAAVSLSPIPDPEPAWLELARKIAADQASPSSWPAALARQAAMKSTFPDPMEKFLTARLEEISEPAIPAAQQPVLLRAMADLALQSAEVLAEMPKRLGWDEKELRKRLALRFEKRRGCAQVRPAAEYQRIMRQLRSKPCLRSGLWRGCAAESFIAPRIKDSATRPANWEEICAELDALDRWEFPTLPEEPAPPLEVVKRRSNAMSEAAG